jgi:hypothetical protein
MDHGGAVRSSTDVALAESSYECLGRDAATNGAPDGGSEGRDELDVDVGLEQGGTDLFEDAVEGLSM